MNKKQKEILTIAQEECAEVIQAISKIFRFGITDSYPVGGINNKAKLENEMGDLICMIALAIETGIVDEEKVKSAAYQKRDKLKIWSGIFK